LGHRYETDKQTFRLETQAFLKAYRKPTLMTNIFSTYSTGENRVTASLLAVLRSLSLDRMERLIGNLLEQSDFKLIRFVNQPSKGGSGIPDALIQSSIRLLLETKTARNAVSLPQIKRHLERLDQATEAVALLLVLTPDDSRPSEIDKLNDQRVVWTSFAILDQAIDEMLDDKYEVVSEREAFLLRGLQEMLVADNLVANSKDVLIVAARSAWDEYQEFHAYVCQPNRPFQSVTRMGFYSRGVIYPFVPKITAIYDEVEIARDHHKGELGKLVNRLIDEERRPKNGMFKVFLLSAPDSEDTIKLDVPIPNNKVSKTGKTTAFTMGHRYVSSDKLRVAKSTSELD